MGKYIINFEDNPGIAPDREKYYKCCEIPWWVATKSQLSELTPYTELDLDAIRKEAYAEGYKEGMQLSIDDAKLKEEYRRGLNDAWEAARKIADIPYGEEEKVLGSDGWSFIVNHTASEAIEKIRQYEQEQEEIKVGDEVVFHHDDERPDTVIVVTYIGRDEFIDGMDGRGMQYAHNNPKKWTKTGRHFSEIAEVLAKMKEA